MQPPLQTSSAQHGYPGRLPFETMIQRHQLTNMAWLLSEHFGRLISGFIVGVLVARYLGPSKFGIYNYVVSITAFLLPISKLGLDAVVVHRLVDDPARADLYLGTAARLKARSSAACILFVVGAQFVWPGAADVRLFLLIGALGFVPHAAEVVDFHYQALTSSRFATLCRLGQIIVSAAVKVVLVATNANLIFFFVVMASDGFVLAALYVLTYKRTTGSCLPFKYDPIVARDLLVHSWPLLGSSIATIVYMRLDQVLITNLIDSHEAGIFAAASRLTEAVYILPTTIANTMFPAMVAARAVSATTYERECARLYGVVAWTGVACATSMSVAAGFLVSHLFGPAYRGAETILVIQSWGAVFMGLLIASGKHLVVTGDTRAVLERNVAAAAVSVGMNLLLIPHYGGRGSAIAALAALAASSIGYDFLRPRHRAMLASKWAAISLRRS